MSRRRRSHRPDRPSPRLVPPLPDESLTTLERLRDALASDHWCSSSLGVLAERVGGVERLAGLTGEPLTPVVVDPERYDDPTRSTIHSILVALGSGPTWMVAGEDRSIVHGLIERLARESAVLSVGDPTRTAAALVWLVARSRDQSKRPDLGWIWGVFGVSQSAARAHALYRALGFAAGEAGVRRRELPDPELITSCDRRRIISSRDAFLDEFDRQRRLVEEAKPIRHLENGQLAARGGIIRPVWVAQGTVEGVGRRMVLLAVDRAGGLDQPPRDRSRPFDDIDEVISLSVPDAWKLVGQLQQVLAAPASAP